MNNFVLEFDIVPSNVQLPLGIEVWIDEQCLVDKNQVVEAEHVRHEFDDNEQEHVVKLVLKNKTAQHTQINENLEIVSDSVIEVKNFRIAEVNIDQAVQKVSVYHHNFNSNGDYSEHKFYNTMGCNGTVTFKISVPPYLWLLEHT